MDNISRYVKENKERFVEEVRRFLQMPSISGSGLGIKETASFLEEFIRSRLGGDATQLVYGGHPIVYGRVKGSSGKKMVIYNMYDVQPVEPLDQWISPPFEARIVGDRIIARGAYNTKGALLSSLLGVEIYSRLCGELPLDIIFVLEGEEELGSPSMPKFVEDKKSDLVGSELVFFAIPSERRISKPSIVLGNKGIVFVELRSRTSGYDVHSSFSRGLYNPAVILSHIISHLIDPLEGPKIPWLDEKALTPTEEDLKYLNDIKEAMPFEELMEAYKIYKPRLSGDQLYIAVFFKPTVNVDGFTSGYTGPGTKTITPSEAVARLDFRLVPGTEPEDVIEGLKKIINRLGLSDLVEIHVHDAYTWSRTDPRNPYVEISRRVYGEMGYEKTYIIPNIPGSAPGYLFTRVLDVPMISTAPGHGGRAHAPNEYITIDTIPKIIEYTARLIHRVDEKISSEK